MPESATACRRAVRDELVHRKGCAKATGCRLERIDRHGEKLPPGITYHTVLSMADHKAERPKRYAVRVGGGSGTEHFLTRAKAMERLEQLRAEAKASGDAQRAATMQSEAWRGLHVRTEAQKDAQRKALEKTNLKKARELMATACARASLYNSSINARAEIRKTTPRAFMKDKSGRACLINANGTLRPVRDPDAR